MTIACFDVMKISIHINLDKYRSMRFFYFHYAHELMNRFALYTFALRLEADTDVWNMFIEQLGDDHAYFSVKWLHGECYLYRRINSIFAQT